jgi:glucose-6-phosphate 1-dehydrogenase
MTNKLVDDVAKAIADSIGNGQREKYYTHAQAALDVVLDRLVSDEVTSVVADNMELAKESVSHDPLLDVRAVYKKQAEWGLQAAAEVMKGEPTMAKHEIVKEGETHDTE